MGAVRQEDQPLVGERVGDEAAAREQQAEATLRRVHGEARLVEPETAGHVARLSARRLEIASPCGKMFARLVVVDERGVVERALGREAGRQQAGRAYGIDALVHQIIASAAGHVAGRRYGDVERAFGEIAVADRRAEAEIDVRRHAEEAVELGHQPERRQRGRGGDHELAALAAPGERHQRALQLVETLRQFTQSAGGDGVERELAVLAVE